MWKTDLKTRQEQVKKLHCFNKCSGDRERLLKFKAKGREFTNKILTEQFWKQNAITNSLISLFNRCIR